MDAFGLPDWNLIDYDFWENLFRRLIGKPTIEEERKAYLEREKANNAIMAAIPSFDFSRYDKKMEQLGLGSNDILDSLSSLDNATSAANSSSLPNESLDVVPTIDNPSDYPSLVNASSQMAEKEMLWNAEQARLAWERSEESAQRAFERTLEARRNQIPDLVESYKRAGLNPYLAYSSSGTGVSSPTATAYNSSYSGYANSLLSLSSNVRSQDITKLLGLLSSYIQMKGIDNVTKQLQQSLGLGIAGNAVSILTALIKAFA